MAGQRFICFGALCAQSSTHRVGSVRDANSVRRSIVGEV